MTLPSVPLQVDHRFSPLWWQTLICMPDDPVKTLVGREGQFFLDYGSGGPRNFLTSIRFDLSECTQWVSQDLPDANVPVLVTRKGQSGLVIEETTFLEVPSIDDPLPKAMRYDGFETLVEWAKPSIPCDPAFCDAAVRYPSGSHEASLEVHLFVEPYAARIIALGFCEGRHSEIGNRRLIAFVEGAEPMSIDPVEDFGPNVPGVHLFEARDLNGDGRILISLKFHPDTHFSADDDRVSDLRTIMLSAIWAFEGEAPTKDVIVSGTANSKADIYSAGRDLLLPHRRNHLLVSISNESTQTITARPVLVVGGILEPIIDGTRLRVGPHNVLTCSEGFGQIVKLSSSKKEIAVELAGIQGTGGSEWSVDIGEWELAPGENRELSVLLDRFPRDETPLADPVDSNEALAKTLIWWHANGPSQRVIEVPDPGVQRMIDSSVRNIFQARDLRNGFPSFHVGPTVYRGLFLVDGAFMLELAAMLNRVDEARAGIKYLQSFELTEGGFNVIDTYYKENGIAAYAIIRHARLTNDKDWLRAQWKSIRGCVKRIQALRRSTPAGAPNEGLLPAGAFCDGGVFNNRRPFGDYSNVAWCLSGLKWAYEAAQWIGEEADALGWETEYRDFRHKFQIAAERDLRDDCKGNIYLPVVQGNGDEHAPPRGQWAFCHSVYPGGIYADDDPIVLGNLAMLRDAMVEGVVLDTGWMQGGLWPYFSSFYAHALQWIGQGYLVPQILYDFANHSSPTLVWREEQKPQGEGYEEVGDMPHNWASAEFLRMVVHMLQMDRGEELHLLEGFPASWARPGLITRLNDVLTPFGPIDLKIEGVESGIRLQLTFDDSKHMPQRIVVHSRSWGGLGDVELPVQSRSNEVVLRAS